jgi:hypothetical protein
MKKLLVGLALILGLIVGFGTQCPQTQPAATPTTAPTVAPTKAATPALELVGASTKSFTLDEVKALPATEGFAGIKSSTGKITPPVKFKGVALDKLCEQVGSLGADQGINVVAKDGYAMTLSYDQITKGDFITYDPGTGDEVKIADPLKVVIAYEMDGKPLNEEMDGTFRLVVVSAKNNQVVDGHWSVKWVTQVVVKSLAQEWTLQIEGAITEKMDRGTFESCSAPGCHGVTWKDDKAQEWKGVPLWLLVARADDEVKHGTGAFNEKVADQGYKVDVVAADGYKATLDSARLKRNNNILVANTVNGNPLDETYFPLRLVGSDLQKNEMAGQVAKIVLHLTVPAAPTPAPTPTQRP